MARIKRGVTARARHNKILSRTKGTRGTNHNLFRRANEAMLHALSYATSRIVAMSFCEPRS